MNSTLSETPDSTQSHVKSLTINWVCAPLSEGDAGYKGSKRGPAALNGKTFSGEEYDMVYSAAW